MRQEIFTLTLSMVAAGCGGSTFYAVRASSLDLMPVAEAEIEVAHPAAEVTQALQAFFEKRGFQVVNKVEGAAGARYYFFAGPRQSFSSVEGHATAVGVGNVAVADSVAVERKFNVGSWFAARVTDEGERTKVFILGKPTLNGQEVCSDADKLLSDAQYWCQDTKLNDAALAQVHQVMTGREERDVAKGVLIEIGERKE